MLTSLSPLIVFPLADQFDLSALEARAAQLVEAVQSAGADAADAIAAASRSTGVEVRNGEVEEIESSENNAFVIRAFVGKRSASVSANVTGDLKELAQRVVSMAKVSPENPMNGLCDGERLAHGFPDLDLYDDTDISIDQMKQQALACEQAALSVPGVSKSSGASFGNTLGGTVLATSHGFLGSYRSSRFSLSVAAVAGEGEKMERDYDFDSQHHAEDLRNALEIGQRAGKRAAERVNPRRIKTQTAPVIYDPRVARSLVSHLASAINGASIARKSSFLRDDMGKRIFTGGISIIDEPHLMRGVASRPFDGEGARSGDLVLVENGVLQQWFLDTATANELGLVSNARANRSGSSTTPGPTNLTLLEGNCSPASMIEDIKSGFYVTELIGQGVNMTSGDYSRGASGYWIEGGRLTYPVSEVTIAGNLRTMFAELQPASDLEKRFGTNAPTIFVPGMTIAGE